MMSVLPSIIKTYGSSGKEPRGLSAKNALHDGPPAVL